MSVPFDEDLGVHPQAEGFTQHEVWNFEKTRAEQYPLLLHVPYFELYRKQVVKQADLVLAMHLRGDAFTAEQKARNFAYYERLTVRDSSLSASTQAVIAAEVGQLDLASALPLQRAIDEHRRLYRQARPEGAGQHESGWRPLPHGPHGLRRWGCQPIRSARDTMIPSGPRTSAMRQMFSY
jgi:Glycosyl hydrolase family 65 central catalytic domain